MRRRRLVSLLLTLALCCLPGCAVIEPNHVAVFCEHDAAESDNPRGTRTATGTNKIGVSATYDLHPDR